MTLVFLFPGQTSRSPAMIERALERSATARSILRQASEALGLDLERELGSSRKNSFSSNENVQIAVFLANHLALERLRERGVESCYSAGASLGELNHLVHIGALALEPALHLVRARGRLFDRAPRGRMVALFPVGAEEVARLLERRPGSAVFLSNDNSPQQLVVAGDPLETDTFVELIEDELGARGFPLDAAIAMHTPLMLQAAERFRAHLERAPWQEPQAPYLAGVVGRWVKPSPESLIDHLVRHVWETNLLRRSVDFLDAVLRDRGSDPTFVEVGCGTALTNLLERRWKATCLAVDELSDRQIADLREPGVAPELAVKKGRQHARA